MSNKIEIGINQRIPIGLLEMSLQAVLEGTDTPEYFYELAATEYHGENRIKKATYVMNRLTHRNPLMPFLQEHKEEVLAGLRNKPSRTLILSGIINAAYSFGYDLTEILGKYLHVQEQVPTHLLSAKLAEKYGSNRSLPNAMNCIIDAHRGRPVPPALPDSLVRKAGTIHPFPSRSIVARSSSTIQHYRTVRDHGLRIL